MRAGAFFRCLAAVLLAGPLLAGPDPVWQNLSSRKGELPSPPGGSTQQTGAVVGDFDGDLDLLNKPYTWDTPRVDVWLNRLEGRSPMALGQDPEGLVLESLTW